jgi:Skp family chaperone for outer membrane proteins
MQVLDVWANQRADEVEKMRDQVTETTERLNAQRTIATEDVLRELENELLQAQRELEDAARALRSDFDAKQMELLSEVATRVREIADEYARANGFDAIFMLESQPLLYVAESAIITDAVVRLYDQRYPAD